MVVDWSDDVQINQRAVAEKMKHLLVFLRDHLESKIIPAVELAEDPAASRLWVICDGSRPVMTKTEEKKLKISFHLTHTKLVFPSMRLCGQVMRAIASHQDPSFSYLAWTIRDGDLVAVEKCAIDHVIYQKRPWRLPYSSKASDPTTRSCLSGRSTRT